MAIGRSLRNLHFAAGPFWISTFRGSAPGAEHVRLLSFGASAPLPPCRPKSPKVNRPRLCTTQQQVSSLFLRICVLFVFGAFFWTFPCISQDCGGCADPCTRLTNAFAACAQQKQGRPAARPHPPRCRSIFAGRDMQANVSLDQHAPATKLGGFNTTGFSKPAAATGQGGAVQ